MAKKHQHQISVFQIQCGEKWFIGLLLLLFIVFGVGGCGGTDNTSPSAVSEVFFTVEGEGLSSPITVDVNPAEEISINNLTIRGVNAIHEYRVMYYQFDGNPQVPPPFMMKVSPSMLTREDGALTLQNVILLNQDALSAPPFTHLIGTDETLTLGTVLEFWGENENGNVVGSVTTILVCSDN